jgi:putative transposase
LHHAHSLRFIDKTATEIYFTLLDEDIYLCSRRTMYRILTANKQVRDRRNLLRHPKYKRPELLATGPNQLWSWDITYLRAAVRGVYFYLYVILDVFSRCVVGWMLAHRESGDLATRLIGETCSRHKIPRGQLTTHADNGAAMKAKTLGDLFEKLAVTESHSRPSVSNDNPYSESQFKTLKYCPQFPGRFGSFEDAHAFCQEFFDWYNGKHFHSGICWLTPGSVHEGRGQQILNNRHAVINAAYDKTPTRFVNGRPQAQTLPATVWINAPLPHAHLQTVVSLDEN